MDTGTLPSTTSGSSVRVDSAASSHVGYVRGGNEDSFLHDPDRGLFVVADGMGGHPAGDVASRITVETLDQRLDAELLADDPTGALTDAVYSAHEAIGAEVDRDPATEGMGTTVVGAYAANARLVIASIGDSRAYRLRDRTLTQLTSDDVWEAVFGRSLTQALGGGGDITPEVLDLDLAPGDKVLLCTDGLTDMCDDELIADVLDSPLSAEELVTRLEACALDHGGYDNVTLIVIVAANEG